MSKPLVIFHGNCADGFTAAWAIWTKYPDWEFYAATYGDAPPDVVGRDVVIVDFSYKRPVIEAMVESGVNSIVILDHHKSAQEDLEPYRVDPPGPGAFCWGNVFRLRAELRKLDEPPVIALFDMERSGAMITWDVFHPNAAPPQLLRHVEDRDLWRFDLPGTREIQAAVFSYEYEFPQWEWLMRMANLDDLRKAGAAIERKRHKDVAELVDVCKRRLTIGGYDVPVASLPYTLASDAGHLMAQGEPFAACYWDTADGRTFSLRSNDDGLDVSEVAVQYGGGGHRNAAGFKVPREHELAQA